MFSWKLTIILMLALCLANALPPSLGRIQFGFRAVCSEITVINGVSVRRCGLECLYRPMCDVFNYHTLQHTCQLCTSNETDVIPAVGYVTSDIQTWNKGMAGACETNGCKVYYRCDPDTGSCVRSECDVPPDVMNTVTIGSVRLGHTVKLACEYVDNYTVTTCDGTGDWSPFSLTCDGDILSEGWFLQPNVRQTTETVNSSTMVVSDRLQCIAECENTTFCIAVNFNRLTKQCFLSRKSVYDQYPIYTAEEGWDLMYVFVPVFHVQNGATRYAMTFQDGAQACSERGTTMASLTEVWDAFYLGYVQCNCGWINDERAVVLVQAPDVPHCHDQTGLFLCNWQTTWNVLCKTVADSSPLIV